MSQDATVPPCSQCGKPDIIKVGANALCVDHYKALQSAELMAQQAMNIKWNQAASLLNQINAQLDRSMPFGPPHPQMPLVHTPSFVAGNATQITVSGGSTVGAINTGTVQQLNVTIKALSQIGQTAFADTIQEMCQAVVDDQYLSTEAKQEALEQIEALAEQAGPPHNCEVMRPVFGGGA